MAISTIKRPYNLTLLDKQYLQSHIVNNTIIFTDDTFATARVVNNICFINISAAKINAIGNQVKIIDGLPSSIIPMRCYSIIAHDANDALKQIIIDKDGSLNGGADSLYMTTTNMAVGDSIGAISLSYPIN